jgi:hypothetical protein
MLPFLVAFSVGCSPTAPGTGVPGETDGDSENLGCDSPIDPSSFLMSFHLAHAGGSGPQDHTVALASSPDGENWTRLDAFDPEHSGSVPGIVSFNGDLLLFHTRAGGDHQWDRLNACLEILEQGTTTLEGGEPGEDWVDPSPIVDGDELVLFYLPGIMGSDPAGCPDNEACDKEIRSARATAVDFPTLQVDPDLRAGAHLDPAGELRSFSDPSVIAVSDHYDLFVSAGSRVLGYRGTSLDGEFESPNAPDLTWVSRSGGVPDAVVDPDTDDVWLYVHTSQPAGTVIRRAVMTESLGELNDDDFQTVLDGAELGDPDVHVESPHVIVWPW